MAILNHDQISDKLDSNYSLQSTKIRRFFGLIRYTYNFIYEFMYEVKT